MKNISPTDLHKKIINKENIQLIDVREPNEHEAFNIGGELMPLSEIAIQRLEEKFKFSNLVNLRGGVYAWLKEIKAS